MTTKLDMSGTESDRSEIHIMVWPDIQQIEIWTDRGKSFAVKGEKAVEFAQWLETNLVDPLLGRPTPPSNLSMLSIVQKGEQ